MKWEEEEFDVAFNPTELTEFLYAELTDIGYAVTGDEAFDITDIVMDYLLQKLNDAGVEIIFKEDDDATS